MQAPNATVPVQVGKSAGKKPAEESAVLRGHSFSRAEELAATSCGKRSIQESYLPKLAGRRPSEQSEVRLLDFLCGTLCSEPVLLTNAALSRLFHSGPLSDSRSREIWQRMR